MLLKDLQATDKRCFVDSRSYVRNDKTEVLYGEDWKQRKEELWERSGGRCEQIIGRDEDNEIVRCGAEGIDPHHVIPRSSLRDDRLSNLALLCRACHQALDKRKPQWSKP